MGTKGENSSGADTTFFIPSKTITADLIESDFIKIRPLILSNNLCWKSTNCFEARRSRDCERKQKRKKKSKSTTFFVSKQQIEKSGNINQGK